MSENHESSHGGIDSSGRREFLVKAGRFAVVTPAAVTVLLSTSLDAEAGGIHKSGGYKKDWKKNDWNQKKDSYKTIKAFLRR